MKTTTLMLICVFAALLFVLILIASVLAVRRFLKSKKTRKEWHAININRDMDVHDLELTKKPFPNKKYGNKKH